MRLQDKRQAAMCRMPNGSNFSWTLIDDKGLVHKLWDCKTRGASLMIPIFPQHSWLRCYMPKRPPYCRHCCREIIFCDSCTTSWLSSAGLCNFHKKKKKNSWQKSLLTIFLIRSVAFGSNPSTDVVYQLYYVKITCKLNLHLRQWKWSYSRTPKIQPQHNLLRYWILIAEYDMTTLDLIVIYSFLNM